VDKPRQQETETRATPWAYLAGTLAFVAVCFAFALLLDVPAPDESTTSLVGLVVAAIGLVVALAAAREARRASDAAAESLDMARNEHDVFLAQLQGAAFSLTLRAPDGDEHGVVETGMSSPDVDVAIGVKNTGSKAARECVITLMVPEHVGGPRWTVPPPGIPEVIEETTERLAPIGGEAKGPRGKWISRHHPYIGRRSEYEFRGYFHVDHLPEGGRLEIPVRAKAESDDMPDDMPEPFVDAIITVQSTVTPPPDHARP
jgi:hypothetical protein